MRKLADKFQKHDATIVLKGRERIHRWIAEVHEDRVITYPIGSSLLTPSARIRREPIRYSQMLSIGELDPPTT